MRPTQDPYGWLRAQQHQRLHHISAIQQAWRYRNHARRVRLQRELEELRVVEEALRTTTLPQEGA